MEAKRIQQANIAVDYISQHLLEGKLLLYLRIYQLVNILFRTFPVNTKVLLGFQVDKSKGIPFH
jgi:hypothetical protein